MGSPVHGQTTVDLAPLGKNDLSNLQFSMEAYVSDDCMYSLEVHFVHDPNLPHGDLIGEDPTKCLPGVIAPEDGLPYIEGRWAWERLPKYVRDATGFDHVSLDWNPCGHPGPGFLTPHYDAHFYGVSPDFRATNMTCDLIPGTPVCDAAFQETENGQGFFNIARQLAPVGFDFDESDAVIFMGLHGSDHSKHPATPANWTTPSLILVEYDDEIVAFEPMFGLLFFNGTEHQIYEEDVVYQEKDPATLPDSYSINYFPWASTHIALKGKSAVCAAEFEQAKTDYELNGDVEEGGTPTKPPASGASAGSTVVVAMTGLSIAALVSLLL
jgi:hypothetical protein